MDHFHKYYSKIVNIGCSILISIIDFSCICSREIKTITWLSSDWLIYNRFLFCKQKLIAWTLEKLFLKSRQFKCFNFVLMELSGLSLNYYVLLLHIPMWIETYFQMVPECRSHNTNRIFLLIQNLHFFFKYFTLNPFWNLITAGKNIDDLMKPKTFESSFDVIISG